MYKACKALLLCALMMGGAMAHAGAPKAVEQDVKVFSRNKQFYAVAHAKERQIAVFRAAGHSKPVWAMSGYSQVLFLSDDGKHLVEGYSGGNILDPDVKGTEALLTFIVEGRQTGKVTVDQLFPHHAGLQETTDGWAWGDFWGFETPTHFSLMLKGNHKVTFDADNGKQIGK